MARFAVAAGAAFLLLATGSQTIAAPDSRATPMQFDVWTEGPAQTCGSACRTWVSAAGAITADTPRDFETFVKGRELGGVTIALDSDGGSVLGALALGRTIRRLGMITTVGKTVPLVSSLAPADGGRKRARLQPRAYCESMCAFVLLAGIERRVPAQARVMVHQIWLGDRRDDPTAASYSAEDLVVVQRDIGRLAQYTVEMGGGIDLLEIALTIPPWEPMRLLTRDELRSMKILAAGDVAEPSSGPATNSAALANGKRGAANGRGWIAVAGDAGPALGRSHPLTVEGKDIGSFDLTFACGETGRDYAVSYTERRRGDRDGAPAVLTDVRLRLAGKTVPLKIVSSRVKATSQGLDSVAAGQFPADLLQTFAGRGSRSLVIETASDDDSSTAIRVGNAGMAAGLSGLEATCATGSPRIRNSARASARQGG
jgi:hypothetical protein